MLTNVPWHLSLALNVSYVLDDLLSGDASDGPLRFVALASSDLQGSQVIHDILAELFMQMSRE
jgi:hypothetical protein